MAKRQTKRALITSVVSLLVCFSMLVGTTFAWFTDSVTSSGNIIKSGTLDVTMHFADGKADAPAKDSSDWKDATNAAIFKSDLWEPGYTEARHIKIENKGTLALKYQLKMIPSGIVGNLAEVIDVYYSNAGTAVVDRDTTGMTKLGTLDKVISELDKTVSGELAAGENIVFTFVLKMQDTAGNEYQNSSIGDSFSLQLLATQAVKESDSFGDDYDADAPFIPEWDGKADELPAEENGVITINDAGELAALAAAVNGTSSASTYSLLSANQTFAGKTVKLGADINLGGSNWTPIGLDGDQAGFQGIFDGNGHTIYNLTVDLSGERAYQSAGLFGSIHGATIKNLNIVNATIKNLDSISDSSNGAAVVVGSSQFASTIDNVDVTGATVTSNKRAAGIAGYFNGTIKNCDVKDVTLTAIVDEAENGSYDNGDKVGGIVALTNVSAIIENNTVENATITGYRDMGGIVGCANPASVNNNSVKNLTFVIDKTHNYKNYTTDSQHLVGDIVGRGTAAGEGNTSDGSESFSGEVIADGIVKNDGVFELTGTTGMQNLADVIAVTTAGEGISMKIKLLADVDLKDVDWTPIDKMWVEFDGNGHTISNLTVNGWKAGLFGYLGGGFIKNLTLKNVNLTGAQVGAFAGACEGTIENCTLAGDNYITWEAKHQFDDPEKPLETHSGIGAITGVLQPMTVNATIAEGATVTLNYSGIVTEAAYVDELTGYIAQNNGTVVNNGTINVVNNVYVSNTAELTEVINSAGKLATTIILSEGTYDGDFDITLAALGAQKGDFTFKGEEGKNVVFSGTFTLGYREQTVGAAMWNANVTFEGVTFDNANAATHSLDVQDVKSLTLKNCKIIGDGEYGITSARGNATGKSSIVGCTFENAGMQLLGNFATGLVIDDCDFNDSRINVQAGNGVTVRNCRFNATLTDANVGDSFYLVRSNSTPITVENCKISIDSTVTGVASAQAKWGIFWNRGTTNWSVSDVEITMTDAAVAQTELLVTKTTSTGVINVTNVTVNGVAK